jgi:hypothetical protein
MGLDATFAMRPALASGESLRVTARSDCADEEHSSPVTVTGVHLPAPRCRHGFYAAESVEPGLRRCLCLCGHRFSIVGERAA